MCTLFTKLPKSYNLYICVTAIWQSMIQVVTPYDIELVFPQKITFVL